MNYQKIYNQIIERAQTRKLKGYVEKHHIVPKCIGGLDIKENIVELTAREHFLCHRMLCEIYPKNTKLWYALWLMVIGKNRKNSLDSYILSSRTYESLKLEFIKRITGIPKPSNKGRIITWGDKISKSLKGKPKPEGFSEKISKPKVKNFNNKIIQQFDLDENFIKEWPSAREVERELKIHSSAISCCLKQKTKTSGGYIWKYKE
jgi:hypothetical protein